ncbi:hypothetical protein ACP70R_022982 [Stipagrostis hirtigluma subsp. patula]
MCNHHAGPRPTPSRRLPPRRGLRCTLPYAATSSAPSPPPSPPPAHQLGAAAAAALADFEAALAAAVPHLLPASASIGSPASASQFYADLAAAAQSFLRGDGDGGGGVDGEGFECRCAVVLSATVAALLAFTLRNVMRVDAKSQMVLVTRTGKPTADEVQGTRPTAMHSDVAALKNARSSVPVEVMNSVTY